MRTCILCRESDRTSCVDYCAGSAHWVPPEPVIYAGWSHSAWNAIFHNQHIPKHVADTWGVTHRVIWCVIKCSSSTRPYNIVLTGNIVSNDQMVFLNSWNIKFHETMMWKLLQVWDCRTKENFNPQQCGDPEIAPSVSQEIDNVVGNNGWYLLALMAFPMQCNVTRHQLHW